MARIALAPGDILLYHAKGLYGWVITRKTAHPVGHVEIYDGRYKSWASRDGKGVSLYDLRLTELMYVLRPQVHLDLNAARGYGAKMIGTPYGWLDLLQFYGFNVRRHGIVCSPFAAGWMRAAGWDVFPVDNIERVAPFQFLDLVGPECKIIYAPKDLTSVLQLANPL